MPVRVRVTCALLAQPAPLPVPTATHPHVLKPADHLTHATHALLVHRPAAKNQVAMNPRNTVFDAKRLIGRHFSDPVVQVSHLPAGRHAPWWSQPHALTVWAWRARTRCDARRRTCATGPSPWWPAPATSP
jgi:hypothetical protein